jgi:subtilisin-like proprotein convertase family protein
MKKITFILCFLLTFGLGFSQSFTDNGGPYPTQNGQAGTAATCGTAFELTLPLDLSAESIGTLGGTNFLQSVQLDVTHTWSADVIIQLQDPSGTVTVQLTDGNFGQLDGFNITLSDSAFDVLPTGNVDGPAATGTFLPVGNLSDFNGVAADGIWNLLVCDDAGGDVGDINSWTLNFAPVPLCTPAVVNGTSIINDCGIGEFSIEVDVDSVGEADFINDGTTDYPIVAGSNIVGPYPSGSTITLSVVDTEDSDCDFSLADVTFTCPTIPGVDAILTINGCLDSESFNDGLYDASVKNIYWAQLDYDGGCFELTVDTEGGDFDTEIGLYDSNGFLIGSDDDSGTDTLSIFTEAALPAGTYYIAAGAWDMTFGADNFNVTSTQTATTGSLFINASTPSDNTVDFCNIQFPGTANIQTGDELNVFARVFEAGVTEPQGEQGAGIEAWIGYSETDATTTADFTSGDWTWVVADYNTSGPANNDDEYFAEIGSGRAEGTYYYVSRFSIDGGPFVYGGSDITDGDGGNFWDGTVFVSGILTVTNPPPPANDLCENATVITCDDILTGQTTIQATGGSGTSCNGSIGDDVWYQISGNDSEITITVDASVQEAQIGVFESTDGTCGGFTLGTCIASVDDFGGNPTSVSFQATSGTEYFIQVGNWINGDPGLVFEISVTCTTCPAPSNLDVANITEISADLSWDENGTATEWNIEYGAPAFVLGAGTPVSGVTNPYTLEGLVTDTDYEYYVQAICGGDTSGWAGPFAFSTLPPPPANDNACDAIMLNIGDASTGAFYSNVGATVEPGEVGGSCYFFGDPATTTVWFSFVAPTSGEVLIATEEFAGDGTLNDTQITLFTLGDCSDLSTATEIACDEDDDASVVGDGFGLQANLQVTGLVPGNTYYFVIDGFDGDVGTFDVALSDPTLSIGSFDNEMTFKYFPNPVSGALTLKAQQSIQNVTVLNMLGQEVLRTSPNALESNVDMSALNTGSYFVQVTINNVTEIVRIIKN